MASKSNSASVNTIHPFIYLRSEFPLHCNGRADCMPQSLKHLLPDPLENKFAADCSEGPR